MRAIKVKRQKDALGAACQDCPAIFNITTCPYWHWSKSLWMHKQSGHKLVLYTLVAE